MCYAACVQADEAELDVDAFFGLPALTNDFDGHFDSEPEVMDTVRLSVLVAFLDS